ncbi:MAG: ATP-dependent metallopeptidase FtsH/Yme1/Tma family protein, partial [Lachnospiraceae bacterium]|nr:ATP-dependent metallopeptidase FtsH/Yme1/Tma family protein [Lachnospiraceae bacterium]
MNKKNRGYNVYFILVLLLLALLIIPSLLDNDQVEYSRGELLQDLENGNVVYASITPSRQTPTGEVNFILANGPGKTLYVTDVTEIEKLLISHGINPDVKKVQEESWFLTSVFPVLLAIIVMVFFFV